MNGHHVYLVSAYVSRESETVVAGFDLKRDAEAFAKRCKEYDAKQPRCPSLECHDDVWDKYNKREANWRKRHPAKVYSPPDDYFVTKLKIRPAVWPRETSKLVD